MATGSRRIANHSEGCRKLARPKRDEGTNEKSPSNLNNCAVLLHRLIPPTYTTSKRPKRHHQNVSLCVLTQRALVRGHP